MKEIISTENAPAAVGPYSQAIKVGHLLYTAGQIALDPETMTVVGDDVQAQTHQVLKNLTAVLEAAGSGLEHVVKTTVFLRFIKDYGAMNEIYAQYFMESKPARSAFAVGALPLKALVEIEAVAVIPGAEPKAIEIEIDDAEIVEKTENADQIRIRVKKKKKKDKKDKEGKKGKGKKNKKDSKKKK